MRAKSAADQAGFTLAEMLIAATLGALLLAAAASTAGTFTESMAQLQTEAADSYENVVARIDRDVRYAWMADVVDRHRLQVIGPDSLVTEYRLVGNSLFVTRPDGSTGSVITGLGALDFAEKTLRRLRSGSTASLTGTMASKAPPSGVVAQGYAMDSSTTVGLSFVRGSDAGARSVTGVSERYMTWQPTLLSMSLARVGTGTVTFRLYPSFGPGLAEPRPGGSAIATWSVNLSALPVGVVLASPPAVPRTLYAAPTATAPMAVPALAQPLEPGVAYTLTLDVSAGATLIISHYPGAARTDQMYKPAAGAWTALSSTIPFVLRGNAACTSTVASDVTTQVRTTMQSTAGGTYVGSACVYSQVLAEDPWLGVVSGELPAGP